MSGLYFPELRGQKRVVVEGEEFHHLVRVLRAREGERVWLIDGAGLLAEARLRKSYPHKAELEVIQTHDRMGEPPAPIGILIGLLKQPARIDWLVEKAVELGATHLYFLAMHRSARKHIPAERLQKVAIAAAKQNLRSLLPQIQVLRTWDEIPLSQFSCTLMGEIGATLSLYDKLPTSSHSVLWMVGPEGDFTEEEYQWMKQKGVEGVSLGVLRLRAETAAILFLSAIKTAWRF
ncbi:MAG: 16S rRNA (uracil(1498)-N(3))-methyltransferase [Bacteroidia bacterium]|nr:16S rRNA (uracil(1498)-N(3))-methyltransferase [Bacteroidia bacterium]MDW8236694.1 RsmE family RNA methyltransferase [Bacteroidia bacterium]